MENSFPISKIVVFVVENFLVWDFDLILSFFHSFRFMKTRTKTIFNLKSNDVGLNCFFFVILDILYLHKLSSFAIII